MGKFVISKRANGEFQFNLKATNGQVILTSEGYACQHGIDSVKTNSQINERFEKKTSTNNKLYFVLKALNGLIIGTSEMYESNTGCDSGIESVKTNAPSAIVEDLS